MKKKEWNEGLDNLAPDVIEKYVEQKVRYEKKKRARGIALRLGTAAACLCLAVIMVAALLPKLWADPTPPTPSNSDIFYNENGELDEDLIFANLSQVVWDTSVTSPEEEKPLGQIYEWNGLRLEEDLYNAIVNAGENDLFAVRVIYDGTKLYDRHAPSVNAIEDIQGYIDTLKTEVEQLEGFKAEVEAFLETKPTKDAMKSFCDKSIEKYGDSFVNNYVYNGEYNRALLESRLTELNNYIPKGNDIADPKQALLENMVLLDCHDNIQSFGIKTARPIDGHIVAFGSESIFKSFIQNIDQHYDSNNISEKNPRSEFVFTLAPAYLVEKLKEVAEIPSNGYYDPDDNTSFAFSKLKFYSTDAEFAANLDVIKEVKKCYDYYDNLTFKVTYSGNLPAEKLSAMEYSAINKSKDGTTVTVTVNYSNFDSDALKELSRDTNVKEIFVSYPEGAEMGFGKNKIYFGYPGYDFRDPEILSVGKELINDRNVIIERINRFPGYNIFDETVNSRISCQHKEDQDKVLEAMITLGGDSFFNIKCVENEYAFYIYFNIKTETFNKNIEVIKKLSHMSEVKAMSFSLDAPIIH